MSPTPKTGIVKAKIEASEGFIVKTKYADRIRLNGALISILTILTYAILSIRISAVIRMTTVGTGYFSMFSKLNS